MTDKLRKYVLPNIPYVFIGWVFLKLGTAYRISYFELNLTCLPLRFI